MDLDAHRRLTQSPILLHCSELKARIRRFLAIRQGKALLFLICQAPIWHLDVICVYWCVAIQIGFDHDVMHISKAWSVEFCTLHWYSQIRNLSLDIDVCMWPELDAETWYASVNICRIEKLRLETRPQKRTNQHDNLSLGWRSSQLAVPFLPAFVHSLFSWFICGASLRVFHGINALQK